ncbi:Protein TraL [Polaromonas vacuolata]|uniref:Protein TraL n=1 Tax=Polaromonas vacuolata TaxID=37448 RepID=A0A6H2H9A6_9BURK|nr:mobilization protein [Polaromonas vacuolata]QJC56458.1 Protein TraL [Polaromonas vacuolata]
MASINFIGGEKGGVGKSVTARVLAQYFIDKGLAFTGFDTDRSHHSFNRFYADYASPVMVDNYEGLDLIVSAFEDNPQQNVIVDLAAQTSSPLAKWIGDASLLELFVEMGIRVNFWHVMDDGRDAVDLLGKLIDTYGKGPNYIVVKNQGRGTDFVLLKNSYALQKAESVGAQVIELPRLHDASMRKIDQHNTSFWKAVNDRESPHSLGILERQRVKTWLKNCYQVFDQIPGLK